MNKNKDKTKIPTIERRYGLLVIDGHYYAPDQIEGKPVFIKIYTKEVDKKKELVQELIPHLIAKLDGKAILEEAMMKLPLTELSHMKGMLTGMNEKPKVKTRRHHCVDLLVGDSIIPIINNEGI
jgi:hypothetical protein